MPNDINESHSNDRASAPQRTMPNDINESHSNERASAPQRTMPEEVGFRSWNWNAPLWLGFNTINVNGTNALLQLTNMARLQHD